MSHAPVLLHEAVAALAPKAGDLIVDATFGGGGYTRALLEAADCKVIALDRDPDAMARAQAFARLTPWRLEPREGRFGDLDTLVPEPVDGVALDLGVSSFQLDEPERGFSFRFDAPLDMRMAKAGPSAADVVAQFPEEALADAIWALGEETASRRIARALVEARREAPVATTAQLADLVEKALGGRKGARTHPATKTFQALRMLVNDELGELARALAGAETRLKPRRPTRGGVLPFSGGQDREIVHGRACGRRRRRIALRARTACGPSAVLPSRAEEVHRAERARTCRQSARALGEAARGVPHRSARVGAVRRPHARAEGG